MNEPRPLGPEARAAIAAEIRAPGAEAAARRRLRERLWSSLAIAPIVPALAAPPVSASVAVHATSAAGTSHSFLAASGRLLALVARYPGPVVAASLTVGGMGGIALHAGLEHSLARRNEAVVHASRVAAPPSPAPSAFVPLAPSILPTPTEAVETAAPTAAPVTGKRSTSRTERAPASAQQTSADLDLLGEAALVERARTALARGRTEPALLALEQHRQRFPEGQLVEEREALIILTLALTGRSEDAARLATTFEKRFPGSLWLEQVEMAVPPPP